VAVLFIAAAPAFWHRAEIQQGEIPSGYENADLYQEVYPAVHYGFSRLRHGELPLWNSKQQCGVPFHANPAFSVFQPLNLVFAFLPTDDALAVHAFLCLALMGVFFALFVRTLDVGYVPAVVGGVAYAFCGASAAAMSRPALANALVWIPLVFWGVRAFPHGFRYSKMTLAGIAGALLILSGAYALVVAMLCLLVPYRLFAVFLAQSTDRPAAIERVEGLVLMGLVAVAVSAAQWAPAIAWAWSLHEPWRALFGANLPGEAAASVEELAAHLLVAKPGALPRLAYLGPFALLAVPAAPFHGAARRDAWFFLIAAPLLLFLSVGALGHLPLPFSHAYFVFPATFSLAVLATLGLDRLLVPAPHRRVRRVWLPALVTAAAAAGLFYVVTGEARGRVVFFAVLMLPALIIRVRWVSAACGMLLALLLFGDLAWAGANRYRHPFEDAQVRLDRYARTIQAAEEQAFGQRVLVSGAPLDFGLPQNLAMLRPALFAVGGTMPLTRDQAAWWRRLVDPEPRRGGGGPSPASGGVSPQATKPNLLNYMAARLVLAGLDGPLYEGAWGQPGPELRPLPTEDAGRLFVNDQARPRAFWVLAWRAAEGAGAAADALSDPSFDGTLECVIDPDSPGYGALKETVPGPRELEDPLPAGPIDPVTCSMTEIGPERVRIRVVSSQPGVTVLADTFDSDWSATLNGAPAPILRANGLFRGVATPAGEHEIVFVYRPVALMAGMAVSLSSLALLALMGFVAFVRG